MPNKYRNAASKINPKTDMPELFRALLVGGSGSGKTNLVMDILKRSPGIYTHLHICARNPHQPIYEFIQDKLGDFCTVYEQGEIPDVDSIPRDGLQLFIFDDYSNDPKLTRERVVPYFIRGRHYGFSSLYLSHAFHQGTPKLVRLNVEYVMILKVPSRRDLDMVLKDVSIENCSKDTLFQVYKQATASKGQFLMCDCVKGQLRFNFLKKISLE